MDEKEEIAHMKLMVDHLKELIRTKDEEVQGKNTKIKVRFNLLIAI